MDIAAELGVSAGQIRKWKSQDQWEDSNAAKKRKGNVTHGKKNRGGQPGNENSKKHGFYTENFGHLLGDSLLTMLQQVDCSDPEAVLESEIELYTMRELLLLQKSFELSDTEAKLIIDSATSLTTAGMRKEGKEGKEGEPEEPVKPILLHNLTKTVSPLSVNHKITEQLTKVQRAKVAAARALAELQQEGKGDDDTKMLVNEWVEGVLEEELDDE